MLRLIFKDEDSGMFETRTVDAVIPILESELFPAYGNRKTKLIGFERLRGSCEICHQLGCQSDHK